MLNCTFTIPTRPVVLWIAPLLHTTAVRSCSALIISVWKETSASLSYFCKGEKMFTESGSRSKNDSCQAEQVRQWILFHLRHECRWKLSLPTLFQSMPVFSCALGDCCWSLLPLCFESAAFFWSKCNQSFSEMLFIFLPFSASTSLVIQPSVFSNKLRWKTLWLVCSACRLKWVLLESEINFPWIKYATFERHFLLKLWNKPEKKKLICKVTLVLASESKTQWIIHRMPVQHLLQHLNLCSPKKKGPVLVKQNLYLSSAKAPQPRWLSPPAAQSSRISCACDTRCLGGKFNYFLLLDVQLRSAVFFAKRLPFCVSLATEVPCCHRFPLCRLLLLPSPLGAPSATWTSLAACPHPQPFSQSARLLRPVFAVA